MPLLEGAGLMLQDIQPEMQAPQVEPVEIPHRRFLEPAFEHFIHLRASADQVPDSGWLISGSKNAIMSFSLFNW